MSFCELIEGASVSMSKTETGNKVETFKSLELKLVECLGIASTVEMPMAATLIGAALEEIGGRIEQELGVLDTGTECGLRYDN